MKSLLLLPLLTIAWPSTAFADPYFALGGKLSDTHLGGISSPSAPTLFSGSLDATLGLVLGDWLLIGATSGYQWTNQFSNTAPPVGNWRGTRWNIVAPTLGLIFGPITLQGDYEFLGSYKQTSQAQDGSTVSYGSPSGFEVSLSYSLTQAIGLGLFYRSISFATQESSSGGTTTLSAPLKETQYGLSATFVLYGASRSEGGR